MNFEQYLRDNPMPTKENDKKNYHTVLYGTPPRCGKTIRQDLQLSLQDYRIEMNVPKTILKEKIDYPKQYYEELHEKIINKAKTQLIEDMKKESSEYPDEILTAFVEQFIDLKITKRYNIRTKEYSLIVTPIWKDVNLLDFDSEFGVDNNG